MAISSRKSITLFALLIITIIVAAALWFVWYEVDRMSGSNDPASNGICGSSDARSCPDESQRDLEEPETANSGEYRSEKGVLVYVDSPASNSLIRSPVALVGKVPGNWSFEATFPIEILDADRRSLGQGYATLEGDWMTEQHVVFSSTVTFTAPESTTGFIVLKKANASGLPENEDSAEIPIRF